jgi:hypothetical protein
MVTVASSPSIHRPLRWNLPIRTNNSLCYESMNEYPLLQIYTHKKKFTISLNKPLTVLFKQVWVLQHLPLVDKSDVLSVVSLPLKDPLLQISDRLPLGAHTYLHYLTVWLLDLDRNGWLCRALGGSATVEGRGAKVEGAVGSAYASREVRLRGNSSWGSA